VPEGPFQRDLERFVSPSRPVALARFHDGEYHVLQGQPYDARSGWHVYRESWIRQRLLAALRANLEDYWVGISPPCDYPVGTAYYRSQVQTANRTFATIFWHSNYGRVRETLGDLDGFAVVGCTPQCDYPVPANGVAEPWDIDALVAQLREERRPILVAAGPSACVIVHDYWRTTPPRERQTILDIGAAIDPVLHGRRTRDFQEPNSPLLKHSCDWSSSVPWSPKASRRKLRGNKARLAGLRTPHGGKQKQK
jgi:hypothetical protein